MTELLTMPLHENFKGYKSKGTLLTSRDQTAYSNSAISSNKNQSTDNSIPKLPKAVVFYQSHKPPSLFFDYACHECVFYIPNTTGLNEIQGDCHIITNQDVPDKGFIGSEAWCIAYVPNKLPFMYLLNAKQQTKWV